MTVKYAEYQEKIGAVLKDGHVMFRKDIVKDLNRKSHLEEKMDMAKELHVNFEQFDYEQLKNIIADIVGVQK